MAIAALTGRRTVSGSGYDPTRRHGWARGLIHFHTQFSDGWASVTRAGEIARDAGYDFLIITDHIRNLKLFTHRTLREYVAACDEATTKVGIPVIPGGEMEVHWDSAVTEDFSEAHTLALSIRDLVAAGEFDFATPETDPFWHWLDSEGGQGTILALQEKLSKHGLPPLASHQFQHSLMGTKAGEHSDYRYDLARIPTSRYLDFFYSGTVELIHEMEDLGLVLQFATPDPDKIKAVYTSCDFHIGPQTMWKSLAHVKPLEAIWGWLLRKVVPPLLQLRGNEEAAPMPLFADEQLSHATYNLSWRPTVHRRNRPGHAPGRAHLCDAGTSGIRQLRSFTELFCR